MYKLLIVDDEVKIANGIKQMFNWAKFNINHVELAFSYHEALLISKSLKPDIIISDIQLNDGWGYDIIDIVHKTNPKCAFIMISGYDQFDYVKKSLLAGAKDYILKPIDKNKLDDAICKIIKEEFNDIINDLHKESTNTLVDTITHKNFSDYSSITKKIISIIKKDYGEDITLTSIADVFMMNSKYLGRIFLKDTGLKFSEYLLHFRMETAKDLIINTDYKIQTIAKQIGFSHTNYFYTVFKQFFNVSPNSLRQEYSDLS